jgi:hypothetical protein
MKSQRTRVVRRNSTAFLDLVRLISTQQTMLAVGLDPQKGFLIGCVKTPQGEKKWKVPLKPEHMAMLEVVRGLLG